MVGTNKIMFYEVLDVLQNLEKNKLHLLLYFTEG